VCHSNARSLTAGAPDADTPEVNAIDSTTRRRHERVRLGGIARLIADRHDHMVSEMGSLLDLSEGGCRLRFQRAVEPHLAARVRLDIAGDALWLPVLTRWVQRDAEGWTVGCRFDGLTAQKQDAIRRILAQLDSNAPATGPATKGRSAPSGFPPKRRSL
jgi:hypothetical protein